MLDKLSWVSTRLSIAGAMARPCRKLCRFLHALASHEYPVCTHRRMWGSAGGGWGLGRVEEECWQVKQQPWVQCFLWLFLLVWLKLSSCGFVRFLCLSLSACCGDVSKQPGAQRQRWAIAGENPLRSPSQQEPWSPKQAVRDQDCRNKRPPITQQYITRYTE